MLSLIKIMIDLFARFRKRSYLCTVFFMVLDLRLTEEGRREMAFFSFYPHIISNVPTDLDTQFDAEVVVFGIFETYEESNVQIVVVNAVAQFMEEAVPFGP